MSEKAIELYLNDHMGGATMGADLAERIRDRAENTPLGDAMRGIATEIAEDREQLQALIDAFDASPNPVKQIGGWAAEKASRIKFSGVASGESEHGLFMALETLRLGVAGKKALWLALREVRDAYPELREIDLDNLIERADRQERLLETERVALGREVLAGDRELAS